MSKTFENILERSKIYYDTKIQKINAPPQIPEPAFNVLNNLKLILVSLVFLTMHFELLISSDHFFLLVAEYHGVLIYKRINNESNTFSCWTRSLHNNSCWYLFWFK